MFPPGACYNGYTCDKFVEIIQKSSYRCNSKEPFHRIKTITSSLFAENNNFQNIFSLLNTHIQVKKHFACSTFVSNSSSFKKHHNSRSIFSTCYLSRSLFRRLHNKIKKSLASREKTNDKIQNVCTSIALDSRALLKEEGHHLTQVI